MVSAAATGGFTARESRSCHDSAHVKGRRFRNRSVEEEGKKFSQVQVAGDPTRGASRHACNRCGGHAMHYCCRNLKLDMPPRKGIQNRGRGCQPTAESVLSARRAGARVRPCRSDPHAVPHAAPLQIRARLGSRESGPGLGVANKGYLHHAGPGSTQGQSARAGDKAPLATTGGTCSSVKTS